MHVGDDPKHIIRLADDNECMLSYDLFKRFHKECVHDGVQLDVLMGQSTLAPLDMTTGHDGYCDAQSMVDLVTLASGPAPAVKGVRPRSDGSVAIKDKTPDAALLDGAVDAMDSDLALQDRPETDPVCEAALVKAGHTADASDLRTSASVVFDPDVHMKLDAIYARLYPCAPPVDAATSSDADRHAMYGIGDAVALASAVRDTLGAGADDAAHTDGTLPEAPAPSPAGGVPLDVDVPAPDASGAESSLVYVSRCTHPLTLLSITRRVELQSHISLCVPYLSLS
jgi:hypothetical protein